MIKHVLVDADGVLQHLPGGWVRAMEPYLGDRSEQFLRETWEEELPTLSGHGDYLPLLAARLQAYGVSSPVEEIYAAVWLRLDLIDESFALISRLREQGYGVHLATNQEARRADHMRHALGYDEIFDVSCYSCDLGVAKPEAAFFIEAARRIGSDPNAVVFIDDSLRNVESARDTGMAAIHWEFTQGHQLLRDQLTAHGVSAEPLAGH